MIGILKLKLGLSNYIPAVVYLGCIIIFIAMLVYKREIGLYFVVAIMPLRNLIEKMQGFPLGKDIIDIFILTLLLIAFINRIQNNESKQNNELNLKSFSPSKSILLYIFATYIYLWIGSLQMGIELPIAINNERLMNWKNHMILPALFFITLYIINSKRQIHILTSVIFLSIFSVSLHFYRNFNHTGGHFKWDRRESGTFSYLGPNDLGAFFAEYSLIILGILFICKLKNWKWPLLGILALNLFGLIFTFSRGAYLAFFVAFLFISLVNKNIKALLLILVCLVYWNTLLPQSVIERFEMTYTEEGGFESSSAGRIQRWEHGLNLFLRNPIGHGYETVKYLGFTVYSGAVSSHGDPHNRYVEFLVEMGFIGFILFLLLFYLAFKNGWHLFVNSNDKFMKGLGLGFSGTVIACMISNMFGDRWTYEMLNGFYWVFWALVVRGNMIVQNDSKPFIQVMQLESNMPFQKSIT